MVVFVASVAMAQKINETPIINNNNNIEAAQVKSHSNINNNREENNTPKVGAGAQATGNEGTKKKLNLGKWLKKK